MTATLTDRYVSATLRRVPEKQRPEIEKELRAAIADDVDARVEQGEKPAAAEYSSLKEMGDPYRLAASYTNRVLGLIGPDIYPTYVRSLKLVSWISVPIVYVVLVIISFAQGKNVFASIFGPLGATISVGIYIAFAVTLIFVIAERAQTRSPDEVSRLSWTPDALAVEIDPPSLTRWGDVISQIVGTLIFGAFLLVDRFAPFVKDGAGHTISVLDPHLWTLWIPVYLVLLVLTIALEFLKLRAGKWTVGLAIAETILGVLGAAALTATVLTTTVVNPALTTVSILALGGWVWSVVSVVVGVIWLSVTINIWRPSARTAKAS
ncbi:MAG TPA: permease prefix domain 1-containing protein [Galbitalea sp.]|jgi:hypothetical protein|nr:permease prefix domain 1-containing protein [Galbitalea sp.]